MAVVWMPNGQSVKLNIKHKCVQLVPFQQADEARGHEAVSPPNYGPILDWQFTPISRVTSPLS